VSKRELPDYPGDEGGPKQQKSPQAQPNGQKRKSRYASHRHKFTPPNVKLTDDEERANEVRIATHG